MIDELERRVRTLEEEAEGEKAVTRQVLEQSIRNGDYLLALRSEVASFRVDLLALSSRTDHIAGDVVKANATLVSHGRRLDTMTQDVMLLRQPGRNPAAPGHGGIARTYRRALRRRPGSDSHDHAASARRMTRRKGEIIRADFRRHWPHHVALSVDKARVPLKG